MNLPAWSLTYAIPPSPDAAVRAGMHYASEKQPGIVSWEVDHIALERVGSGGNWSYNINLIDRLTKST